MLNRTPVILMVALVASFAVGCQGVLDEPNKSYPLADGPTAGSPTDEPTTDEPVVDPVAEPDPLGDPNHLAESGMRRLSPREYDATVAQLLGIATRTSVGVLPDDSPDGDLDFAFDNDYEAQVASSILIEGADSLAFEAAAALVDDPERRAALVGCVPAGPVDETCATEFITRFGRRAFRRPLTGSEVENFVSFFRCPDGAANPDRCGFAADADDFWFGVETVVAAMLMNPNFLYRVEIGNPVGDGVWKLNSYEVATRLSYFLWGLAPDDHLLDVAAQDALQNSQAIRAVAAEMLNDGRAREQVQHFHAQWLGYAGRTAELDDPMASRMEWETEMLIDRIIFEERRPWQDIFTSEETWVDGELAAHYGLTSDSADATWVSYGDSPRRGILSHGAFLWADGLDTNPIRRGRLLTSFLLCQGIPPPPDNVPPLPEEEEGECKSDILRIHAQGSCGNCHQYMDAIGNGLEAFDQRGAFRTTEKENPDCEVSGEGVFPARGDEPEKPFTGPGELGALMVEGGHIQACVAHQVFRFAMGRNVYATAGREPVHPEDMELITHLSESFGRDGRFEDLLLALVTAPTFLHRVDAPPAE